MNLSEGIEMCKDLKVQSDYRGGDFLSIFDEQFTVAGFCNALEKSETSSESVMSSARIAIQKAFAREQKNPDFVVVMSDEQKESIRNGDIELVISKRGETYAQLRKGKGRFGKPFPIREELADEGITVEALQFALQMEAIKKQLQTIIEGLKEIEGYLADLIQGQRNDRIGFFYSGLSLYVEARWKDTIEVQRSNTQNSGKIN